MAEYFSYPLFIRRALDVPNQIRLSLANIKLNRFLPNLMIKFYLYRRAIAVPVSNFIDFYMVRYGQCTTYKLEVVQIE